MTSEFIFPEQVLIKTLNTPRKLPGCRKHLWQPGFLYLNEFYVFETEGYEIVAVCPTRDIREPVFPIGSRHIYAQPCGIGISISSAEQASDFAARTMERSDYIAQCIIKSNLKTVFTVFDNRTR